MMAEKHPNRQLVEMSFPRQPKLADLKHSATSIPDIPDDIPDAPSFDGAIILLIV